MNPATYYWIDYFNLPSNSEWWVSFLLVVFIYLFLILPFGNFMGVIERKFISRLEARVGPEFSGWMGLGQAFADLVKLIQKVPRKESFSEMILFTLFFMILIGSVAALPLGTMLNLFDSELSGFIPLVSCLHLAFGSVMIGFSQKSISGLMGGLRIAVQTITGLVPALIAILTVGALSGGFSWNALISNQGFGPWSWNLVKNPFLFFSVFSFLISGLILQSGPIFQSPLAMGDLYGGITAKLYGRRLGYFRMTRFYLWFLWCVVTVALFLGGYQIPVYLKTHLMESHSYIILMFLEVGTVFVKTLFLMLLLKGFTRIQSNARINQTTTLVWKVLLPFSFVGFIGALLFKGGLA
ncbi:MAG: hypothetical protein CL678_09915 [Bdellovibrionaceae bacterium]|nr:hypothetical protein [Pseudobdellovibrionaceae bacterium]|tara:strand:+ start:1450 stop:2508 length:1059 start_codon:yes stop_codon:yes gene_type:complete